MKTIITIEKKGKIDDIIEFNEPPVDAPLFGQARTIICHRDTADVIQLEKTDSDIIFLT